MGGIKAYIESRDGIPLKINGEGEITASLHTHPPIDEKVAALPFRQYFTDNGKSTGSNDMKVSGSSSTPLNFYIRANQDRDIFIRSISIEISDASASLNNFGNVTALSNGIEFYWETLDAGKITIHESLKTNWDFVRLCSGNPSFGATTNAFRASNVSGSSEGYIPFLDVVSTFGLPWGFRLRKGTSDKLVFSIKDSTAGVDSFDIVAYGTQV